MTNIIYTDLLIKKDNPLLDIRMKNEESISYSKFLKDDGSILEETEKREWVQFLNKYGLVSIAIDNEFNNKQLRENLSKAFEQLSMAAGVREGQIGCGKLHIVISKECIEPSGLYKENKEVMLYFNSPDQIVKLAYTWFHFADLMQSPNQEISEQSIEKHSSIQYLLDMFDKKNNTKINVETLQDLYLENITPEDRKNTNLLQSRLSPVLFKMYMTELDNIDKSYKEISKQFDKIHEGNNYSDNRELLARSFEIYIQTQLDKNKKESLITNKYLHKSQLYPQAELKEEQVDIWKMIINKYQKKLQPDSTRQVAKTRLNHSSQINLNPQSRLI